MPLIDVFSARQQVLLNALLEHRQGLTADNLAKNLGISRNATLQHLAGLEKLELVESEIGASTGGRPARSYRLSSAGQELFPRQYRLMAELLIGWIRNSADRHALDQCFADLGSNLASQYAERINPNHGLPQKIDAVAELMRDLGYQTHTQTTDDGASEIVANNCVFHQLVNDCEQVCKLDLSMMGKLLDADIDHHECMLRGGLCCRFGISPH